MEWLGFNIDLSAREFSVPADKIDMLKAKPSAVQKARLVPVSKVASLIGTIISMSLALGPVTRLMTRSLYAILNERTSWCQKLTLSAEASHGVKFWLDKISDFNNHNIWHTPSAVRVVYSDASCTGYGGYMVKLVTMWLTACGHPVR